MKLNTRITAPDGRIGTICYHNLDGTGGVWGEHNFTMPDGGFGNELPAPDFLLREAYGTRTDVEFVPEYEVNHTTGG
ncbi:MAG: hypothetical protein JWN34_379 [Bryobacterales bacterium]|nr:hypothetical protein [Bryobacterales bacterium]